MPLRRKTWITARHCALVRPLPSVQPQVGLQVTFLVEGLLAWLHWADKLFCSSVLIEVHLQALFSSIGEAATFIWTLELVRQQVSFHVVLQMALRVEWFSTTRFRTHLSFYFFLFYELLIDKKLFAYVITLVHDELFNFLECLAALRLKTLILIAVNLIVQQTLLFDDLRESVLILNRGSSGRQ